MRRRMTNNEGVFIKLKAYLQLNIQIYIERRKIKWNSEFGI
jgi:hypothetical protein